MSTLYESLITSGVQPEANELLRDHLVAVWASATAQNIPKPTLQGTNPNITAQHVAVWLSTSPEAAERLLDTTQQIQFKSIMNAAKLKLVAMFKTDPLVVNMRANCEMSTHFEDGILGIAPENDGENDEDNDVGNDG